MPTRATPDKRPDWTLIQLANHVLSAFDQLPISPRVIRLVPKTVSRRNGMKEITVYKVARIVVPVLAAALVTVGCASVESVEKAQATANSAMSAAQQAQQTAQQAGQAAQQAQQTADQARSDVSALSQRVNALAARGPRD